VVEGLGRGGYATVVKVKHQPTNMHFAMKVITKNDSEKKSRRLEHKSQLENELKVMTEVAPSSPFLQQCYLAFENPNSVFFILDLQEGGDLFYHLLKQATVHRQSGFSQRQAMVLLSEVYLALEHLHSHNIVHRDIKIENIMLNGSGHVKLVDFGLAVEIKTKVNKMSSLGSLIYMAPELIKEGTGGRHTDWWAYGVLAYELLTGNTPWSSLSDMKLIKHEILHVPVETPEELSQVSGDFITSLMCRDFNQRLGTDSDDEIRKCEFFQDIDWEATLRGESLPALNVQVVGNKGNVTAEVKTAALESYVDMKKRRQVVSENSWFLGLDATPQYF